MNIHSWEGRREFCTQRHGQVLLVYVLQQILHWGWPRSWTFCYFMPWSVSVWICWESRIIGEKINFDDLMGWILAETKRKSGLFWNKAQNKYCHWRTNICMASAFTLFILKSDVAIFFLISLLCNKCCDANAKYEPAVTWAWQRYAFLKLETLMWLLTTEA